MKGDRKRSALKTQGKLSVPTSEMPTKVSGDAGWSETGNEGTTHGILRKDCTELSIDVTYEGQKWTGVLRAGPNGHFTGKLTDSSGDSEMAQVSGFLYQNASIEAEWLFFGKWLEGPSDDYWVWLMLEEDEQ